MTIFLFLIQIDPDRTIFEQSIELPYDLEWEFPKHRLEFIKVIGSGTFGQVWLANGRGIHALAPREHNSIAIRRRAKLRLNRRVPQKLLNCFLDDDLCDQSVFVAAKTLKGLLIFFSSLFPGNIYLFEFNHKNSRKRCEYFQSSHKKHQSDVSVFIVDFEHNFNLFLVFLLLNLNK